MSRSRFLLIEASTTSHLLLYLPFMLILILVPNNEGEALNVSCQILVGRGVRLILTRAAEQRSRFWVIEASPPPSSAFTLFSVNPCQLE